MLLPSISFLSLDITRNVTSLKKSPKSDQLTSNLCDLCESNPSSLSSSTGSYQKEPSKRTLRSFFSRRKCDSKDNPTDPDEYQSDSDHSNSIEAPISNRNSDDLLVEIQQEVAKVVNQLHDVDTIDQMSEVISSFYQSLDKNLTTTSYSDSIDKLITYIETRLLGPMYNSIFTQIVAENEKQDTKLYRRLSHLQWIQTDHELGVDLENAKTQNLLESAVSSLNEMVTKDTPSEKLNCIVECSKTIIDMLSVDSNVYVSADQLLPAIIYVLIKANPPSLTSNMKFVERFSYPIHLISGETGYFYTNLSCAVFFIENLNTYNSLISQQLCQ